MPRWIKQLKTGKLRKTAGACVADVLEFAHVMDAPLEGKTRVKATWAAWHSSRGGSMRHGVARSLGGAKRAAERALSVCRRMNKN